MSPHTKRSNKAGVALKVEPLLCKQRVGGSSPSTGSIEDCIRLQIALDGKATYGYWTFEWYHIEPDEWKLGGYQGFHGRWLATKDTSSDGKITPSTYVTVDWSSPGYTEISKAKSLQKLLRMIGLI